MKEQIKHETKTSPDRTAKESLQVTNKESADERSEILKDLKLNFLEFFGTEKMPEDLVKDFGYIKKQLIKEVEGRNYLDGIDEFSETIQLLVLKIAKYQEIKGGVINLDKLTSSGSSKEGELQFEFDDELSKEITLGTTERELFTDLQRYFDACRLNYNAKRFKENVNQVRDSIVNDNKSRKLNFYDENEKQGQVIKRLEQKYEDLGLTRDELSELIKYSDLKSLDALEVNSIGLAGGIKKVRAIFDKFSLGDKSKYVALSVGLLVPAYLQGQAPDHLAEAFRGASIDRVEILYYALMSAGAAISSLSIEKIFKDFIGKSFNKKGGIGDDIATNLSEFPADEIKRFGSETVKNRISNAKESYGDLLRTISFDIAPAAVTAGVASYNLWQRSPMLAVGTGASTLLMAGIDKYFYKKSKLWEKRRTADETSEASKKKIEEQLAAHMEIILAGEKDKFAERTKELMSSERVANADKSFLNTMQEKYYRLASVLNMAIIGSVSALIGTGHDKFISGLVYSGTLSQNVEDLFRSKMNILYSIRDIEEMERMFNGYAAEEQEKEKNRTGVSAIESNDLSLKGVSVKMDKNETLKNVNLDIPAGSMVRLGGKSGAGKTTLMKVITGYYKPSSGQVDFGGVDMTDIKKSGDDSIYTRVAYLSQYPYIFDDSLKNNLTFGISKPIDRKQIEEVLKEVGLDKRFKNINEKLLSARGDSGNSSGGETSRIGLARTLLKIRNSDSKLVFLDEPSASVDGETKALLVELIKKEKQAKPDMTLFVISHDEEFVQMLNCSMEVQIKNGSVSVK